MKLAVCLGVLAVVLGGSRLAAAQQEPVQGETAESHDRYAIGVIGSEVNNYPVYSAGVTAAYSPRAFHALGGELSLFVLAGTGDCRTCLSTGTMLLPFGELRTPWSIPVNLFMRVSLGSAFGNVGSGSYGSTKVLTVVRAAAGLEYRIGSVVYLRLTCGADQRICTSVQDC